ncbi:MAG TPA: helix-turn-helix transcriptional regulator [Kofleriaceae bacterium]|jgi:transcriptional regulator with XRE-family HTH domain
MPDDGLRKLGALIRTCRSAAALTQAELGRRAGIVGKYVSEIERGTRDVPFSTLRAIAEDGLGLVLDVRFRASTGATATHDEIPAAIAGLAREIAGLAPEQRHRIVTIVKILLRLANH